MSLECIFLVLMLIIILIASYLFTNALEYFGEKMGISEGVIGSIFAAVATALPETSVPILALIAGSNDKIVNQEISVGAILGAPLMLVTLSTFLLSLFALQGRGLHGRIKPEAKGLVRDLNFFLIAFLLAAIAMFLPQDPPYLRILITCFLILLYVAYLTKTIQASPSLVKKGNGVTLEEPLILTRLKFSAGFSTILFQLSLGLVLLLIGAKGFIVGVTVLSKNLGVSALILSLLVIPIATELPEKINSIMWIRKNKDTLGFGNITGAMVFQGSMLPAMGILLTPWMPSKAVLTGMIITLLATIWLRINIVSNRGLSIPALFLNGLFYGVYLLLILG